MTRKIIFLNGCINSGKTTVANRMKERVPNLAHVEVDDLHRFISWMPIEKAIPLNLKNAAHVTRTFVAAGLDVVITYPLSEADYGFLRAEFAGLSAQLIPVTLFTSLENAKRNRGNRALTDWERDRIEWMYAQGLARPGLGAEVDTTHLTLEEAVEAVIAAAGLGKAPAG